MSLFDGMNIQTPASTLQSISVSAMIANAPPLHVCLVPPSTTAEEEDVKIDIAPGDDEALATLVESQFPPARYYPVHDDDAFPVYRDGGAGSAFDDFNEEAFEQKDEPLRILAVDDDDDDDGGNKPVASTTSGAVRPQSQEEMHTLTELFARHVDISLDPKKPSKLYTQLSARVGEWGAACARGPACVCNSTRFP